MHRKCTVPAILGITGGSLELDDFASAAFVIGALAGGAIATLAINSRGNPKLCV